ncbi:M20/M25/M40 family metallo-hydrolase [Streptomyces albus]|nr:M20/M25/M40 family metallo-hydrolase [Streptomyces albus]
MPAGGRGHAVRAGERPGPDQPAGPAGGGRGRGDEAAGRASGAPRAVGARAKVEQIGEGQPFSADTSSPAYRAMAEAMAAAYPGEQMQEAGQGGSIPLTNTLGSLYPEAEILLIGLSEPEAQIHAPNESVSPEELERLAVTEAYFLQNYARTSAAG